MIRDAICPSLVRSQQSIAEHCSLSGTDRPELIAHHAVRFDRIAYIEQSAQRRARKSALMLVPSASWTTGCEGYVFIRKAFGAYARD
jgi:hypothetical protein